MNLSCTLSATLLLLTALPAHAEWALSQRPGTASITQRAGAHTIQIFCTKHLPKNILQVNFSNWTRPTPKSVMIWIELPDGRTDRQSMDFAAYDGALAVRLQTSSRVLGNLQNAASLSFTDDGHEIARTDARGTGAFRLAVKEQCKF